MTPIELPTRFEGLLVASLPDSGALVATVGRGLLDRPQAWLPAAWLYDDRGAALFDRICELPEYYPTVTELGLLQRVAPQIAQLCRADELVELGSGLARKTHVLLDALAGGGGPVRWVPFDVSETALLESSRRMLSAFPRLSIHCVQGDFTRDLGAVAPGGRRRLVAFLGGTIGNFDEAECRAFLPQVAGLLAPGDHLLVAADLVKDRAQLHAAYNDSEGVTAAFNLNTLERLRRELQAELSPADFRHDAFFDEQTSRIEMHVRAVRSTTMRIPSLDLELSFEEGKSIRTEISRKFTTERLEALLTGAGLEGVATWVAEPGYALCLGRRR